MSVTQWILLENPPGTGERNMAVDRWMIEEFEKTGIPMFRIYSWNPPCISLGRFQEWAPSFADCPVVRRQTGGGAIYHHREITYSLVCSSDHIGTGTRVKEGYKVLTAFLLHFYRSLGLRPTFAEDIRFHESLGENTLACYKGVESLDILIDGKKIGGNAQRRKRSLIFQHGSIPLDIDWDSWMQLFPPDSLPSKQDITCLKNLLGNLPPKEELCCLLKRALSQSLGAEFTWYSKRISVGPG